MTNSPNPTPNPNRRRRLTADELIAIGVALTGIGTIFFWGIGQKYQPMFQAGIDSLGSDRSNRQMGLLKGANTKIGDERQTIADFSRDRQTTASNPVIIAPVKPIVTTVAPEETTPTTTVATVAPVIVPVVPVTTTPAFTDVPKQFWAETSIAELKKRGILEDFGTGKFDPNQEITRGEYAKMLDRAFADKPTTTAAAKFKDIPTDYPRKEAVDKSVKLGFMTGYSADKFAPNQPIPRYQLQISLAKGLQLAVPANVDTVLSKYGDNKQMPDYSRQKMAAAIDAGLVIKDETANLLKPIQKATRADAAALIYEVLVKEGKIVPQK
ncbi:S-layer homology domain-containing protein [Chamaesiphon sp. GL140_3_metabinner_50]|uniref:S-layer homology domain-containing protein n=1 Tax=Chamaesiphon sp. GL140_3_metabinner_50 TaxID=2970812 RepID=UPI0025F3062C|nr:S-layer homology domain-containing protein [Chamaesiphon sp. GL140_3_metabinner_50]